MQDQETWGLSLQVQYITEPIMGNMNLSISGLTSEEPVKGAWEFWLVGCDF